MKSLLSKTNFKCSSYASLEGVTLSFDQTVHMTAIYRPPASKQNKLSTSMFLYEIDEIMDNTLDKTETTFLVGDFKLHYDSSIISEVQKVCSFLSESDLTQLVREHTHRCGHVIFSNCSLPPRGQPSFTT